MYRILLVEDDENIARLLKQQIGAWGLEVVITDDFHDIVGTFERCLPHLVLLDITLPFYDGYYWCAKLRTISRVPIVFLSSASDNMNIVMAMNMGGDDFIAKPFDLQVLTAKLQAILRRTYDFTAEPYALSCRGAVLSEADATLHVDGQTVELTKNELGILSSLMHEKGKVVPRDALMLKLWQTDCFVDENTLTVNIARLRKKLDAVNLGGMIETKKGIGYLISESKESGNEKVADKTGDDK